MPANCAVQLNVTTKVNTYFSFILMLPTKWNSRFFGAAQSGQGINHIDVATGMRYVFAAVGTDTGHTDSDMSSSWIGNPESITDWAWRANHEMTVIGGRQSLKELEMFPEDYDGVAVGCPAWWTTHNQLWNLKQTLYQSPAKSPHTIPISMFSVIDNFCLTSPQLDTLLSIYNDWVDVNQTYVFSHVLYRSEETWANGNIGDGSASNSANQLWYMQKSLGLTDFTAADLSYGTVALGASVYFHDHVTRTLAPMGIEVDDFYRFFLVPGLDIPGYSDPRHDVLLALMTWVENGTAPDSIIGTKFNDDLTVAKQRHICAFPNQAKYDGTGDVDVPGSWSWTREKERADGHELKETVKGRAGKKGKKLKASCGKKIAQSQDGEKEAIGTTHATVTKIRSPLHEEQ
ncbi:hypothetical protein BPAE_0046g00640 [Botrytis paeoniae]|uniref:Carboxylic ester hydrolase n=1 Tax=Botrytis paeoniae TaxID=278948 RepID=A0A4Z1FZK1_9HELO|nr:hypothetical protein BPAE_0046g00640 [Botrytis paeoniae]